MKNVELFGIPCSGKSTLKKIIEKSFLKNTNYDEIFFSHLRKNNSLFQWLLKYTFYCYKKKIKFRSNYIFKNQFTEYNDLLKKILNKKKSKKIIERYSKILKNSSFTRNRQIRTLDNFRIDLASLILVSKNRGIILPDEGIYQKILLRFKILNKIIKKDIALLIKDLPKPNLIILVKASPKNCIRRSQNRNEFKYYKKEEKNFLKEWIELEKFIISEIKKKILR